MEKITFFTTYFLLVFICLSCSGDSNQKHKHQTMQNQDIEEIEVEQNSLQIELNHGEKWEINDEMKPPIQGIMEDLANFDSSEDKNYELLAENLQERLGELTASCTMTGQSHDELHKWLMPMVKEVRGLKQSGSTQDSEMYISNIQLLMEQFHKYFNL